MSVVFVNNSQETFTPTVSGAVATVVWEACRAAARVGAEPYVITRSCAAPPFNWKRTTFVEYPKVARIGLRLALQRAERRFNGWLHLRQRTYAIRAAHAISNLGLQALPLVLHNDPEMAVFFRKVFPDAFIVHVFHSYHECKEPFRQQLGGAADVIAAVSNFTARWAERYYRLDGGRVKTLYIGVDAEHFRPAEAKPADPPIINYVGRTGREKAPDLLLRAALELARQQQRFKLQLIGSTHFDRFEADEYQQELGRLVTELERQGIAVRRPGHIGRAALADEFRNAHIHVVPSRCDEAFGLTTLEGMASGLALVASNVGGTPEVVGDAALLFERDDVEELTAHLAKLVGDPVLRRSFAERARTRAAEFTWDKTWARIRELAGAQ